jgi:hypothetical protein
LNGVGLAAVHAKRRETANLDEIRHPAVCVSTVRGAFSNGL